MSRVVVIVVLITPTPMQLRKLSINISKPPEHSISLKIVGHVPFIYLFKLLLLLLSKPLITHIYVKDRLFITTSSKTNILYEIATLLLIDSTSFNS